MKNSQFHSPLYKEYKVQKLLLENLYSYDKSKFNQKRIYELHRISPKKENHFQYIACNTTTVFEGALEAYKLLKIKMLRDEEISILDLGCGNGRILHLLRKTMIDLYNLEFSRNRSSYKFKLVGIEANRKLVLNLTNEDKAGAKIINKDMFKAQKEIQNADIIFSYVPIKDSGSIVEFLEMLHFQRKQGAILILPGFGNRKIETAMRESAVRLNPETYLTL